MRGLAIPTALLPIGLDELVWGDRERAYGDLLGFLELDDEPAMREFFASQVSADAAHRERWREGLAEADQEPIRERYERRSTELEAQGYHCAAVLRRAYGHGAVRVTDRPGAAGDCAGDLVLIGGTGRSGTHVLARLLGRHPRFAEVPIESRFHCNKRGMPDLLGGRVTLEGFLEKLRDFWWHRVRVDGQPRGLYNLLTRKQFDAALERFEDVYAPDPVAACRGLFVDLLWPLAAEAEKPGLVEMSSHNVREAQTLRRLFPEARFVHTVRDGRDAASSVTTKTWGPDTVLKGIDWWADRLRAIEVGVRGTDDRRPHRCRRPSSAWSCSTTSSGETARGSMGACSTSSGSRTTPACWSSSSSRCTRLPLTWRAGGKGWGESSAGGWSESTRPRWRRSSARETTSLAL